MGGLSLCLSIGLVGCEPLLYCFTFGPKLLPFPEGKQQAFPKGDLGRRGVREAQGAEQWAALCLDRQTFPNVILVGEEESLWNVVHGFDP